MARPVVEAALGPSPLTFSGTGHTPFTHCPKCESELRVKSDAIGTKIRCPECGKNFTAQEADEDSSVEVVRPGREKARSPKSSGVKTPSCLAGCFLLFVLIGGLAVVGFLIVNWQQRSALSEATRFYDAGKHDEAVPLYKKGYPAAGDQKAAVPKRIVQHETRKGNTAEAKKWIDQGLRDSVEPQYDDPAANALVDEVRAERAQRDALAKLEAEQARLKRDLERATREQDKKAKAANSDNIKANRNLTRDDFRNRVIGMDPNRLIDFIGRPDDTQDTEAGVFWYYRDVAVDPATRKRSLQAQIVWGNNSVRDVNFN